MAIISFGFQNKNGEKYSVHNTDERIQFEDTQGNALTVNGMCQVDNKLPNLTQRLTKVLHQSKIFPKLESTGKGKTVRTLRIIPQMTFKSTWSVNPSGFRRILARLYLNDPSLIGLSQEQLKIMTFQNIAVEEFAEALQSNYKLKRLDLNSLDLNPNKAKTLVQSLDRNDTLEVLNFSNNFLYYNGTQTIAKFLQRNKTLKTLNLSTNHIGHICKNNEGTRALAEALMKNNELKTLIISNNHLDEEDISLLEEALKSNKGLEMLDLSCNSIGDVGARALGRVLKSNTTLRTLILSDTDIGDEGIKQLANVLLNQNKTLKTLVLSRNQKVDFQEIVQTLAKMLSCNTSLEKLDLQGINMSHAKVEILVQSLRKNKALKRINLSNTGSNNNVAIAFASVLKSNTTLEALFLKGNNILTEGAIALAESLTSVDENLDLQMPCNRTLKELDLCDNQIDNEGALAMAEALKSNCSLTSLALSSSERIIDAEKVVDTGAKALADALTNNSTLEELYLSHNHIGNEGAEKLRSALMSNRTLNILDLSSNDLDSNMITKLFRFSEKKHIEYKQTLAQARIEIFELCKWNKRKGTFPNEIMPQIYKHIFIEYLSQYSFLKKEVEKIEKNEFSSVYIQNNSYFLSIWT